jgi:hypothetical protein
MTKANIILLGLILTNHLVGHIMDIREVQATHLVNLPTMGGFLTNHQFTLVGHLRVVPTTIYGVAKARKLQFTTEVKVI